MEAYVGLGGSYWRTVVRGLAGDDCWGARLGCWMRTLVLWEVDEILSTGGCGPRSST